MKMNYGTRVKEIRLNKGIKAKYVAEKAGLSPSEYSAVENGRRRLTADLVVSIANALGVTPDDILCPKVSAAHINDSTGTDG